MVLDQIFTTVNIEDTQNISAAENKYNADREFVRCEFVEMIVRVGFAKYLHTGETPDPSEAIDSICEKNVLAHLEPSAAQDRNDFRRERLYTEGVDEVFQAYEYDRLLRCVFDQVTKAKPGSSTRMMNIKEFTDFLSVTGFFNVRWRVTLRMRLLSSVWVTHNTAPIVLACSTAPLCAAER